MTTLRHLALGTGVVALTLGAALAPRPVRWTAAERAEVGSLDLARQGPPPPDSTNRVADDPRAVALGQRLFFDTRLSANGAVACATCHDPAKGFQDGTPLGHGAGQTGRRTMNVVAVSRGPWLFWDGRKDSPWAQALGPWESPVEHGGTRAQYAHFVAREYRREYEALFGLIPSLARVPGRAGPVPDAGARAAWDRMPPADRDAVNRIFANLGKAVAAYERRLEYGPSRFDRYAAGLRTTGVPPRGVLTADEEAGLRLFIGKGRCSSCHSGPLLSDGQFHNIGLPGRAAAPDSGRASGVRRALADEFNCAGRYSDAPAGCAELRFAPTATPEQVGAFKTPSLRNVAGRAPYMHDGRFATLAEVVDHYERAPAAELGRSELEPVPLTPGERRQLIAFLGTLTGPIAAPDSLLRAPRVAR
ncbi:MAG TPA: cytochrome c peroxidase [Gemmatimonadales bacterium]|nr:cytochrome c peroxidase [Gemmatimonadales bacterium]